MEQCPFFTNLNGIISYYGSPQPHVCHTCYTNLTLIIAGLSWEKSLIRINQENKALWLVIAGALVSLVLVLNIPFLRTMFHFSVLHFNDLLIVFLAGVSSVLWFRILNIKVK